MKKLALAAISAGSYGLMNVAAFASDCITNPYGPGCQDPEAVPEISALEGTAAIAALAAIVLLTWERRRRSA